MKESFHLGLHVGKVRILPHPEPGCVIADAVECLSLPGRPGVRNVRDYVRRHEEGAVKIGKDALDGTVYFVHLDDLTDLCIYLLGKGCTYEDIVLADEVLEASFLQVIFRENTEEVGVCLNSSPLYRLLSVLDDGLPEHRHVGRRLDFRNVHFEFFLVPVGQSQEIVVAQYEGTLPFRRLVRYLVLLHHIAAYQNHKRQAHCQSHRLDGSVELVAGKEFQETLHDIKKAVKCIWFVVKCLIELTYLTKILSNRRLHSTAANMLIVRS